MTTGTFIDPQGLPMPLTASNATEFHALVSRKLKAGWTLAADSPHVLNPDGTHHAERCYCTVAVKPVEERS